MTFFVDDKISDVEFALLAFHPQVAQVHHAVHILQHFALLLPRAPVHSAPVSLSLLFTNRNLCRGESHISSKCPDLRLYMTMISASDPGEKKIVNQEFKLKAVISSSTAEKPCRCGTNEQKLESSEGPNKAILEKWDHFSEISRASSGPLQLIVGLGVASLQLFLGEE